MIASSHFTRRLVIAVPALAALGVGGDLSLTRGGDAGAGRGGVAHLRLLGVNDFHGSLESPGWLRRNGRRVRVGGAATLGAHLDRATIDPVRTIRVHAGDMVGASPLISSHFHDEPSVKAMNLMRFDVGTVGNHEFDEGAGEMLRLIRGSRRQGPGALKVNAGGKLVNTSDPSFTGVDFPYIAANTVDRRGRLLLPPYRVVGRDGVNVGFIGVTTQTTPNYLLARHSAGLRFLDISDTVNRYVPALRRQGVEAIVVLAHSGALAARGAAGARGEIVDETRQMSDDVDVVVAGHTHTPLNLRVGHKLVVEAFSFGMAYDRVDLAVDRESGEVVSAAAALPKTWVDRVEKESEIESLVERYARRVAPLAKQVVGRAGDEISRDGQLGQLVADAQRRSARADLAFVNPGSIRDRLEAGPVSYEDLFDVERFEHRVLRLRLHGGDVRALLEQQFEADGSVRLYASGLRYDEVDGHVGEVELDDGRSLDPDAVYTVAANELLATGDRFSVLRDRGRAARTTGTDLDALVEQVERKRGLIR